MSEGRRRFVRLSIFLLPALLVLATLHLLRDDLRDAAANLMAPRYTVDRLTFVIRGRSRAEKLAEWTQDVIHQLLQRDKIYGFKSPRDGFRIEVRNERGPSECDVGSNRIVIRGISDDAPWENAKPDLARLLVRTMLREGAPDASYSPWFETGVSRFYEGTPMGSRNDGLIFKAARNRPASLGEALEARKGAYFDEVSHSIVAFMHEAFPHELIAEYARIERAPGSVLLGEFQRVFGPNVEKEWHDFLDRYQKGS